MLFEYCAVVRALAIVASQLLSTVLCVAVRDPTVSFSAVVKLRVESSAELLVCRGMSENSRLILSHEVTPGTVGGVVSTEEAGTKLPLRVVGRVSALVAAEFKSRDPLG